MIFHIALRNLTRQKRRTIITSLMLIVSAAIISLVLGANDGTYSKVIDLFTKVYTGHLKIESKSYVDDSLIYYTIKDTDKVEAELNSNSDIISYTKRSFSGGLAFAKDKTFGATLVGLDWSLEEKTTGISGRMQNAYDFKDGEYQVAVGFKLAKYFDFKIGDEVVVIGSGADGSIANDIFIIKSIFKENAGERDDYAIYMDLTSFNEFHSLSGVHEYSVLTKNIKSNKKTIQSLSLDDSLIARPWEVVEKDFYRSMVMDKEGSNISLFIIMLVVGLGVMNTVLMSILERTKEFGLMKALGTRPVDIAKIILIESFLLASFSILFGQILGLLINGYLAKNGIVLETPISYGGMVVDEMISENSMKTFLAPVVVLYVTTFIATIYPITKAINVSPIKSMRGN